MGFAWQRRFRTVILIICTGLTLLLFASQTARFRMPARAVSGVIVALLVSPTVFWWAWLDEHFSRGSIIRRRLGRALLAICCSFVMLPVALFLAAPHYYDALPVPELIWVMSWHLSFAAASMFGLALWSICLLVSALRRTGRMLRTHPRTDEPPAATCELTRRALLTGVLVTTPFVLSGSMMATGLRQQGRFRTRRITMHLTRLPDRLRGLTITHISDLHVGRFFKPAYLPRVVDAVNRLDSDIIAVTGDIVDHVADFFLPACAAFSQMRSRYGRFVVLGNHDLIDQSIDVRKYLRQRLGDEFLQDNTQFLNIDGELVQIAGLDWSRYQKRRFDIPGHEERVSTTMAAASADFFTIALAHHPHTFDALSTAGVDLTLAGHTHGGQVMLTRPNAKARLGCGNLLFRYIWGEYRRGLSAMYVTSGVGNWWPVRVNAPAEIVQIQLV